MEMILALLIFLLMGTAIFALGAAVWAPSSALGARLKTVLGMEARKEQKRTVQERLEQVLEPASRALPRSAQEVSRTRLMLMQAGYRDWKHLNFYYGIRVVFAAAVALLLFLSGVWLKSPVLLLALPALAYFLPRFLLKRMITKRKMAIRLAMPDALDLMVICVEAGLALDQAVQRTSLELAHVHPELSDEFELVHLEVRAGKSRVEALRNLAVRTGVDDIRGLVAVLVQTDRFGTSVAQALRVHSDALRTERRQRAEEEAAKTTIKMIPVLVLFIFPTLFIISLGPVAIQVVRHVLPVLEK